MAVLERVRELAHGGELISADRDAGRERAVDRCGMREQRAPATADVEKALAGVEIELAADQLELRALRFGQRFLARREERARIHHVVAEKEAIEIVGHVIVKADRVSIPAPRVA